MASQSEITARDHPDPCLGTTCNLYLPLTSMKNRQVLEVAGAMSM